MRSVNRRELNQQSGKIIDEVLDTGEPVEVVSRGRGSVIITPKPASLLEQWEAQGLVKPATRHSFEGIPQGSSPRTAKETLDEIRGGR
jgi:prevent-host-death family protein